MAERKQQGEGRWKLTVLLVTLVFLAAFAAACSEAAAGPAEVPTGAPAKTPTEAATPKPTREEELTGTPEPTPSGTAFTPSGIGGRVTFTENTVEVSKAKIGDTVRFGTYEQDNDESNGAEAIEWLVLDKQDGKLLLLSKYVLDCKKYHEEHEEVTWETCTLREWLNGTFYKTAFNQEEQGYIAAVTVENEDNYGTEGGDDTEDKVFLLSVKEATLYFDPVPAVGDPARCTKVTEYAKANGAFVYSAEDNESDKYEGNGVWWLRTPGDNGFCVTYTGYPGVIYRGGRAVDYADGGIRPALWFNPEP